MLAAAPGVVSLVASSDGYAGNYLEIDHGGGITTRYLHARTITKKKGDHVRRGEVVGTVGTTGTVSGVPHVHFDVKLKPAALAEYQRRYDVPTTGFYREMRVGVGVPAETFMDGATYDPKARLAALQRGVKFYSGSSALAGIALAAGFGWLLYRVLISARGS